MSNVEMPSVYPEVLSTFKPKLPLKLETSSSILYLFYWEEECGGSAAPLTACMELGEKAGPEEALDKHQELLPPP